MARAEKVAAVTGAAVGEETVEEVEMEAVKGAVVTVEASAVEATVVVAMAAAETAVGVMAK